MPIDPRKSREARAETLGSESVAAASSNLRPPAAPARGNARGSHPVAGRGATTGQQLPRLVFTRPANPAVDVIEALGRSWGVEPLEPHRIGKSMNDGRAYRPKIEAYASDGGFDLGRFVAIACIVIAAATVVYFAAELLRSAF